MGKRGGRGKIGAAPVARSEDWDRLLTVGLKLRALAYLIENQRADADPPKDLLDIHWGLGALLSELSQSACDLARAASAANGADFSESGLKKN